MVCAAEDLMHRISRKFIFSAYPNIKLYVSPFRENRSTGDALVTFYPEFSEYVDLGF